MSNVITDADYVAMDRQRRLRNGESVEYVASPEEMRIIQAREITLAREIADYEKRHRGSTEVVGPKDLAKRLGITEKAVEALAAEERLRTANRIEHERVFGPQEELTKNDIETPEPIDHMKAFGMTEKQFNDLPVEKRLQRANDYTARLEAMTRRMSK